MDLFAWTFELQIDYSWLCLQLQNFLALASAGLLMKDQLRQWLTSFPEDCLFLLQQLIVIVGLACEAIRQPQDGINSL